MKYIITENRLYEVMKNFLNKNYPTISGPKPFRVARHASHANSGYGSSMHDYIKITLYYLDEDDTVWFKEFDDRDTFEDSKWELNENFEYMFNMFGEENFQRFIIDHFGLNINDKGSKKYDWLFR